MKILAIDTGTDFLSVAIWDNGILSDMTLFAPRRHSELLEKFVQFLMETARLKPEEIDCVAVAVGPGSYTGLRVGISFAQGFCLATGAMAIAVDSLLAMSMRFSPRDIPVAVVHDARAGHIYAGLFDVRGNPAPIVPSALWKLGEFAFELSSRGQVLLCGTDATNFSGELRKLVHGTELIIPWNYRRSSAEGVAEVAAGKAVRNEFIQPEQLEPKYLRSFTPGRKKRRRSI